MTGEEFKFLRKRNRISQSDLAFECGFLNRKTIGAAEASKDVPERLLNKLGKMIGLDLLDENRQAAIAKKYQAHLEGKADENKALSLGFRNSLPGFVDYKKKR